MVIAHATAYLELALLALPAGIVLLSVFRSLRARAPLPSPNSKEPIR